MRRLYTLWFSLQVFLVIGCIVLCIQAIGLESSTVAIQHDLSNTVRIMEEVASEREEMETWSKPLASGLNAPTFSLEDEKGDVVSLENYRGKQVVLVFSSLDPACSNCVKFEGIIQEVHTQYPEVEIIYLNLAATPEQNWKYKQQQLLQAKLLAATQEEVEAYHIDYLPTSVVIDRAGKVVGTYRPKEAAELLKSLTDSESF